MLLVADSHTCLQLANWDQVRGVAYMFVSPADPTGNHVYLVSDTTINWFTTDGGATYNVYNTSVSVEEVHLHPTLANVIIVRELHPACYDFFSTEACFDQSYFTEDFGASWVDFEPYIYKLEWGPDGVDDNGDLMLLVSSFTDQTGDQFTKDVTAQTLLRFDRVPGEGSLAHAGFYEHTVLENSFGFVYLENFVFAVTKDTTSNQTVLPMLLWASQDEGRTMREARFPETLTVNSQITIVDRTDAIALTLWINQNSDFFGGAGYGNLYLSDADGLEYARIIDRVRRRQAHSYDFYNPAGVDGSFFVNQVDEFSETEDFRTLISTDRGGLWRTLRAPVLKLDGTPRNCTNNNDCLLHLSFERLFRPVSTSAAVGMLLVHGMVGRRANTAPEVLQPFVSRDAGSTWSTTVPAGAYHAEIGFRGSIVTLAPNGQTSTLRYTLNEGQTWVTVRNAWQTMQVRDIEHHYSLETDDFVVEGVRFVNGSSRGVVVHIDFTPLNLRVCQGHEMPSSDASDYEYFTPSSTASGCLLGRVVKFIRRKQAVACVDLVENDDKIEETACVCQRADYECDFGYDLNPATLQCLPEPGFVPQTPSQQCSLPGATFYYESQGYRKVLGNQCTGGTIPARVQKSCVDVPRLTTTTTPPPTTTPLTTTMTTTTEMPPTTPPPITTAPSTTTPAPVPTTTMAPTQRTSAPTTVGECLTGGATCSTGGDCCQGFFCEQNRCSECAPAQCPDDVDMQNCQIEMTTDDVGCPKLVCTDCKPVNQEPDTAPPGGLGAGIIILIVALVLLCLGVVVWAAIKLRNRNRFEKHGVEGDTPMSAQDENQLADMQLESDSE